MIETAIVLKDESELLLRWNFGRFRQFEKKTGCTLIGFLRQFQGKTQDEIADLISFDQLFSAIETGVTTKNPDLKRSPQKLEAKLDETKLLDYFMAIITAFAGTIEAPKQAEEVEDTDLEGP